MFMSGKVPINSEDLVSAPSLYTLIKASFLYLFINVAARNLSVPIGGILLLGVNSKGYEADENIYTKV